MSSLKDGSGSLFVVTTEGKVIWLTNGTWAELDDDSNAELRVKRISCCSSSLWAICGDHRLYLRLESDVTVRIKEESYENQRWNPIDGFCNKLLPTDRCPYSSQDGLTDRSLDLIDLPSEAWVWDDPWHLELSHQGVRLDAEGWTYAVDFPRTYQVTKSWNSCVRRRKWVRYRRYNAISHWAPLPPVELNSMMEPFIDVTAGGKELSGSNPGYIAVWAVTVNGMLLYRKGVNTSTCPEGISWLNIETPQGWEPCQVSAGPTGVIWILAWNGQLLARNGITWDNEVGTSWYEVPPPYQGVSFNHISVGFDCAWAVSRENKVFLRKGLDASIIGTNWTEMSGHMNLVFTGTESQVCGLSIQDQKLYLRTGIKKNEPGGKAWSIINTGDNTFVWLAFDGKGFVHRLEEKRDQSGGEPWRELLLEKLRLRHQWGDKFNDYLSASETTDWVKEGRVLLNNRSANLSLRCCTQEPLLNVGDIRLLAAEITAIRCLPDRVLVIHSVLRQPIIITFFSEDEIEDWAAYLTKVARTSRKCTGNFNQSIWALSSAGYPFVYESRTEDKNSNYEIEMISDTGNQSSLFIHDIPNSFYRGCTIVIHGAVPADANRFSINVQCGAKIQPHEALTSKRDVALHINPRFEDDGKVEVVRNSFANNVWDVEENAGSFDIERGSRFTISVQCQRQHFLVKINDTSVIFSHRLSPLTATHLVIKGDVSVFTVTLCVPATGVPCHALWTQLGGHFRCVEASLNGVVWALGEDGTCWIHSGSHGGGYLKGIFGPSSHGIHPVSDESVAYLYENQRWNPVSGFSARGLPTDRAPWSDVTGREAYDKETMTLPNRHWSWTSEWTIDYHPPDGADRDGWQYATDFPSSYHPHKGSFDYVRRRRWRRKCRFTSTGPWFQFGLTKLRDISMQVDHSGRVDDPLVLWAIAANGSILRRIGVTAQKPQGESWEEMLSEHAFKSISIGVSGRVWAVTDLGAPTLRHRVTPENPDGAAWLLLDRPEGNPALRQISAGDTQVWAVDQHNRLYRRKDVVSILPEGTSWELVEEHVLHVSVGKNDQVWAVLDIGAKCTKVKEKGSIGIRCGITASNPTGTGWEFIVGGGWSFICNRGYDIPFF